MEKNLSPNCPQIPVGELAQSRIGEGSVVDAALWLNLGLVGPPLYRTIVIVPYPESRARE